MQSDRRLYCICRREKNKGDQFQIPMRFIRVTGVLVSGLKNDCKERKKERKNQWNRKIICHTQQEPSE
jgi:hypothetical protein